MTSKGRVCLRLADVKRYRVPILGAATWKARSPNERLCHGTESKWLADERVDLAGLWYCMSSVMMTSIKNFVDCVGTRKLSVYVGRE